MDYSEKISEHFWNLPDKGEFESHREETFIDDIIPEEPYRKGIAFPLRWNKNRI